MDIYQTLLYSELDGMDLGCGRTAPAADAAEILIGLGGTGIDAIRTIKTRLCTRLQPDNNDTVHPVYRHIRFLGADCAAERPYTRNLNASFRSGRMLRPLDDGEFLSLGEPHAALMMPRPDWMDVDIPAVPGPHCLGIRQIGRAMLTLNAQSFMARLTQAIHRTMAGLAHPHQVRVHIFSGLSGGTGSGCMLDVCYLVRRRLAEMGLADISRVNGYFYLPQVNLSRFPSWETSTEDHLCTNAHAALQELDHCMKLPDSGVCTWNYPGVGPVTWDRPPVDTCFVLDCKAADGTIMSDGYEHAMDVTAQYVVASLTCPLPDPPAVPYHTLGAASLSAPYRQMGSYLTGALLQSFAGIRDRTSTESDVQKFASAARIDDSLFRELLSGAGGPHTPYDGDWQHVRQNGFGEMFDHYHNQTPEKLARLAECTQRMCYGDGDTPPVRVERMLRDLGRSIDHGPMYAATLATGCRELNLDGYLLGLLQANAERLMHTTMDYNRHRAECQKLRVELERLSPITAVLRGRRLFDEFQYLYSHQEDLRLQMEVCKQLNVVLDVLRHRVAQAGAHWDCMARTMSALLDTFRENEARHHHALTQPCTIIGPDLPVLTLDELQPHLDAQIAAMNIPQAFSVFLDRLERSEGVRNGDEASVAYIVHEFAGQMLTGGYMSRTLASFLAGTAAGPGPMHLPVLQNTLASLTQRVRPLFSFRWGVWNEGQCHRDAFLLVPNDPMIQTAATLMAPVWHTAGTAGEGHIDALTVLSGFPLHSNDFLGHIQPRMQHLLQNPPAGLYSCPAWRDLPPLYPEAPAV